MVNPGLLRRSHRYCCMITGWTTDCVLSEGDGGTEFLAVGVPDDFVAVRVGFANINTEPWKVTRVVACASSSWGDFLSPEEEGKGFRLPGEWSTLTFQHEGKDSNTLVTRGDAPTEITVAGNRVDLTSGEASNPNWTFTDWVPCASVGADQSTGMRVLMLRALIPGRQKVTYTNGRLTAHTANPHINHGFLHFTGGIKNNADWTKTPEPMTAPGVTTAVAAGNHLVNGQMMCLVQVITKRPGIVGMVTGDSHHSGTGTTTEFNNFLNQSLLSLGKELKSFIPMGAVNIAVGGLTSREIFPRMSALLKAVRPSIVALQGWSANERDNEARATTAAGDVLFARMLMAADEVHSTGALPIFLTPFPREKATMSGEVLDVWRAQREAILALRATGALVIDASAILGVREKGELTGTYLEGLSTDSIHPNDVGHAHVARVLTGILRDRLLEHDQSPVPPPTWPTDDIRRQSKAAGLFARLRGRGRL